MKARMEEIDWSETLSNRLAVGAARRFKTPPIIIVLTSTTRTGENQMPAFMRTRSVGKEKPEHGSGIMGRVEA